MRVLRGAVSSMYDLLALATRTMERFGDDSLGMMAHQQPQPPAEEQRP